MLWTVSIDPDHAPIRNTMHATDQVDVAPSDSVLEQLPRLPAEIC